MKFWRKLLSFWRCWKTQFFWVGHFEFFSKKRFFFCFIPMKISHKLYIRIDGTQFLWLWCFTAKNHSPPQNISAGSVCTSFIMYIFETSWNCSYVGLYPWKHKIGSYRKKHFAIIIFRQLVVTIEPWLVSAGQYSLQASL